MGYHPAFFCPAALAANSLFALYALIPARHCEASAVFIMRKVVIPSSSRWCSGAWVLTRTGRIFLCSLGSEHCLISILEKDVSRSSICRIYGDTDAGVYRKNISITLTRLGNPTSQLPCKATDVCLLFDFQH